MAMFNRFDPTDSVRRVLTSVDALMITTLAKSELHRALAAGPLLVKTQELGQGFIGVFLDCRVSSFPAHFQHVSNRRIHGCPR